jgi:hypothetical protein
MVKPLAMTIGLPPLKFADAPAGTPENGPVREVIVSVLVSDLLLQQVYNDGGVPVFADVDPETGGISRASVEAQIGIDTQRILVVPDHGSLPSCDGIEAAAVPRGIAFEVRGNGRAATWRTIAPGLRGWGDNLVEVDEQILGGGGAAVVQALREAGVRAQLYESGLAFERSSSRIRGRRKDYPGAILWQKKMIVVEGWDNARDVLESIAEPLARQLSFNFDALPAKPMGRPFEASRVRRALTA